MTRYPNPYSLLLVFILSFAVFYYLPLLVLKLKPVIIFFAVIGRLNAFFHKSLLDIIGLEAVIDSNVLYLQSGAALEYSPYCFGFLTIAGFAILAFLAPNFQLSKRIIWIGKASLILLLINQFRILFEVAVAYLWPAFLSTADTFMYPLLPMSAFIIWYRGLSEHLNTHSLDGGVKNV